MQQGHTTGNLYTSLSEHYYLRRRAGAALAGEGWVEGDGLCADVAIVVRILCSLILQEYLN